MPKRRAPVRLGEKLRAIREQRGFTLEEMAEAIGLPGKSRRSRIHEWENGVRHPGLISLLNYARLAGTSMENLVDDELEL